MEKMPYRVELDAHGTRRRPHHGQPTSATPSSAATGAQGLPALTGEQVVLRELRASDARVAVRAARRPRKWRGSSRRRRSTVEGFERFIAWTLRQRAAGSYACFAVDRRRIRHGDRDLPGRGRPSRASAPRSGASPSARRSGARACSRTAPSSCSTLRSTRLACIGSKRARAVPQRPRQRRAAEDRRGSGVPAAQVVPLPGTSTSTRCSTRFSTSTGASRARR